MSSERKTHKGVQRLADLSPEAVAALSPLYSGDQTANKPMGQIAYEAAAEFNGDTRLWGDVIQGGWLVAAEAVREKTLQDAINALPVGSLHAADAIRCLLYNRPVSQATRLGDEGEPTLTPRDNENIAAFLKHVLDDYKAGAVSKASVVGALSHIIAALDLDNYAEARTWFEQGRKFIQQQGGE